MFRLFQSFTLSSHPAGTAHHKNRRFNLPAVTALILTLIISGCTTTEPLQQASSPYMDEHKRSLSQLTHWQIAGKIRLKTADSSDSANIQWLQSGDSYSLTLSGPFGQTGALLEGTPYEVVLTIPDEGRFADRTPESLLYNHFGWDLPLSSLFYWVRTLPAPGSDYLSELNTAQQVARLQQDGWDIRYDRYQAVVSGADHQTQLPGRMKIAKGKLELTFIINQWQLPPHQLSLLK